VRAAGRRAVLGVDEQPARVEEDRRELAEQQPPHDERQEAEAHAKERHGREAGVVEEHVDAAEHGEVREQVYH
jgi:hypothetical protein